MEIGDRSKPFIKVFFAHSIWNALKPFNRHRETKFQIFNFQGQIQTCIILSLVWNFSQWQLVSCHLYNFRYYAELSTFGSFYKSFIKKMQYILFDHWTFWRSWFQESNTEVFNLLLCDWNPTKILSWRLNLYLCPAGKLLPPCLSWEPAYILYNEKVVPYHMCSFRYLYLVIMFKVIFDRKIYKNLFLLRKMWGMIIWSLCYCLFLI